MRTGAEALTCRNCGREYPEERVDSRRWCDLCRAEVVRRASIAGRIAGLLTALLLMIWIFTVIGSAPRFVIAWMALVVGVYFFVSNLSRRVAFEVIRGRGVPPPGDRA